MKVRFHLAQGPNFMKWQVKDNKGKVSYYAPEKYSLSLYNAKLRNQRGTAEKIYGGANKTVCAWIDCEQVIATAHASPEIDPNKELRYNPRVAPHWLDIDQYNVDGQEVEKITTIGRKVFAN